MHSRFLDRFRRVTDNHAYLPEVDGLRFLAVFLVVVIMHITNFINVKFFNGQMIQSPYWKDFVLEGNNGVSLFFVISGFILGLPFAKSHLLMGKKVALKHYYLRRVLRIEPPYIIVLLLAFAAHVLFFHVYPLTKMLPSLLASLFYVHTMIYQDFPYILPVAWTLEIEVQFYLLAPIFCMVFAIKNALIRRLFLVAVILANILIAYHGQTLGNVFIFIHFFTSGLLIADLYATRTVLFKNEQLGFSIGLVSLFTLLFIGSVESIAGYYIKLISIFFLMHTTLTNPILKKIFSIRIITIIGGMCYSIYLVHFAIISAFGKVLLRYSLGVPNRFYFIPYQLIFIAVVLLISGTYFLLVEKPFMKLGIAARNKRS